MKQRTGLVTVVLTSLLLWPQFPGVPYDLINTAILACEYLVVTLSIVLLIGLVGQISLCQAALVGMGAFVGALTTAHLAVHFPLTLVVGLVAGAATASLVGVVALRVRGLYLAVATLIFAYVCDQYVFTQTWLVQNISGTSIPPEVVGRPGAIPNFDLADGHTYYYVALAVAIATLFAVANVRESRIGRAFAAIRGSEVAAASLGINVTRFKLLGFACSGALAGLGGALILVGRRSVEPGDFNFTTSLYLLAIAVVGGLRSLGGAVTSSLVFAGLVGEVFFRSPKLADYRDLISAGMLIVVLLFFEGGLGAVPDRVAVLRTRLAPRLEQLGARVRRGTGVAAPEPRKQPRPRHAVAVWVDSQIATLRARLVTVSARRVPRRNNETADVAATAAPLDVVSLVDRLTPPVTEQAPVMQLPLDRSAGRQSESVQHLLYAAVGEAHAAGSVAADGRREPLLLQANHITVRFGGLVAVRDASLQVGAGEIVGLIGPNGAGKTTLFNAILGLNRPTEGTVELYGRDVTALQVHERAAMGVGRTFQILQLFGDLSVFDNLLVATHLQNGAGLVGGVVVSPKARRGERDARERVRAVLRLMDLEHFADRSVAGLPFGVLRLVEVARTLVTGARLVCFDEPASGLDSTETERLIEWFRVLRQIGITLLVIEHDVSMVVRLCDYIYVLDQGQMIATGTPAQVQRDPQVVASYLGTAVEVAS